MHIPIDYLEAEQASVVENATRYIVTEIFCATAVNQYKNREDSAKYYSIWDDDIQYQGIFQ